MTAIENCLLTNAWYDCIALFAYGTLTISSFQKITDEQKDVAQRFAKVFEQTYTRFLRPPKSRSSGEGSTDKFSRRKCKSQCIGHE